MGLGRLGIMLAGVAAVGIGAAVTAATDPLAFLDPGYLSLIDVVPPAPIPQEPRGQADHEVYKLTRALKGTERWTMAVGDNASDTATMMRAFSCATRLSMTPATAPRTAALIERAASDSARETNEVRGYYKRRRPFLTEGGEPCVAVDDGLATTYDYPSAQATRGWTWALVLAEALHERAAPILARGRAYGESAVVCGTHSMSAVEAGRMSASATMAVVQTEQPYTDALVAVRKELGALQQAGKVPTAQACTAEEMLVTQPIFR